MESGVVATSFRIEDLDDAQERVGVLAGALCIDVDVRERELAVPEGLQEAQQLWSLRGAGRTVLGELLSQCGAFNKGTVLCGDGEEAATLDFFPQVKTSLVPILANVRDVIADDGPQLVGRSGGLIVLDEILRVRDQSGSPDL